MSSSSILRCAAAIVAVVAAAGCASVHGGSEPSQPMTAAADPAAAPAAGAPVVVELFTSQGCSSCPPADRLLSAVGSDASLRGRVIPLAFHVDYWNSIGWEDPFSSEVWTSRQSEYQRAFKTDSVYTPQAVVNGRAQLVGSDEGALRKAIAETASGPTGRLKVTTSAAEAGTIAVDVAAETPAALDAKSVEAVVVLYESGLVTSVKRGENNGRELHDDYVVRRLDRAFSGFEPKAGASTSGRVSLEVDPAWNAANLGVAVFLQDPETMRIYGAATAK